MWDVRINACVRAHVFVGREEAVVRMRPWACVRAVFVCMLVRDGFFL